ncbi:hypothetical protein Sjap_009793 [Stephania japonica]|uniref:Small auxin up regulated protein n=1 Tax=Stephania japonica TaxID=461633 RepID=A0AAP0J8C2_9MAGN
MIEAKKLMKMARKWQKAAAIGRIRRISLRRSNSKHAKGRCGEVVADKGHFVVYTIDKKRFVIPLKFLSSDIFKELFRMSAEEFGLPGNGPITLPCDSVFMEYVVWLVRGHVSKDLESALLMSLATGRCCSSSILSQSNDTCQPLVQSF